MPSYKGPKRVFELVPTASDHQGPSKIETDKAAAKSQRRRTGSGHSGDDFAEFVAVLDRIQYMKTNHADWLIWSPEPWHTDVKVIKTETPWVPSFEWEDFCKSGAKDTKSAQTDICSRPRKENGSSCEEMGKQSIRSANHLATPPFLRDACEYRCAESFDLNVEASS